MRFNKKIFFVFLITVLVAVMCAYTAISFFNIPDRIVMFDNKIPDFGPLYSMHIVDNSGVLKNNIIEKQQISGDGNYNGTLKMFGLFDVKDVKVEVDIDKKLIPCGNSIGVKMYTDGILVVGLSEFENTENKKVSPAKKSGVKVGDLIKKVNGAEVFDSDVFINKCEKSKIVNLEIERSGRIIKIDVEPNQAKSDGKNKLGMWVRDSTAGIGTLTFIDPETGSFAALGHGITDIDTGEIMPIKEGSITASSIVAVKKGEKGIPGELQGVFLNSRGDIGQIALNTKYGIYGNMLRSEMITDNEAMLVAPKEEVKEGKAYILSNVTGQNVKKYDVEIQKIILQNDNSTKGIVVKITDNELIEKTGGIVQGMSGSPIIQNEKLVGAVTHVFVNDPTRGYGIFIENMLAEGEKVK